MRIKNKNKELNIKFNPVEGIKSYLFKPSFLNSKPDYFVLYGRVQLLMLPFWIIPLILSTIFMSTKLFGISILIGLGGLALPLVYWGIKFWIKLLFKIEKSPDCYMD